MICPRDIEIQNSLFKVPKKKNCIIYSQSHAFSFCYTKVTGMLCMCKNTFITMDVLWELPRFFL